MRNPIWSALPTNGGIPPAVILVLGCCSSCVSWSLESLAISGARAEGRVLLHPSRRGRLDKHAPDRVAGPRRQQRTVRPEVRWIVG